MILQGQKFLAKNFAPGMELRPAKSEMAPAGRQEFSQNSSTLKGEIQ
ncbi:MAG: hypothetical protein AAF714_02025 [Pseudomonadota bacterium]